MIAPPPPPAQKSTVETSSRVEKGVPQYVSPANGRSRATRSKWMETNGFVVPKVFCNDTWMSPCSRVPRIWSLLKEIKRQTTQLGGTHLLGAICGAVGLVGFAPGPHLALFAKRSRTGALETSEFRVEGEIASSHGLKSLQEGCFCWKILCVTALTRKSRGSVNMTFFKS